MTDASHDGNAAWAPSAPSRSRADGCWTSTGRADDVTACTATWNGGVASAVVADLEDVHFLLVHPADEPVFVVDPA